MYVCPVCGYDSLRRPPTNFLICPSCGTEFGYSDSVASYLELQERWLLRGMPWHSSVIPAPSESERLEQLMKLSQRRGFIRGQTLSTPGRIHIDGTIVPGTKAPVGKNRVTFYGKPFVLMADAQGLHA